MFGANVYVEMKCGNGKPLYLEGFAKDGAPLMTFNPSDRSKLLKLSKNPTNRDAILHYLQERLEDYKVRFVTDVKVLKCKDHYVKEVEPLVSNELSFVFTTDEKSARMMTDVEVATITKDFPFLEAADVLRGITFEKA